MTVARTGNKVTQPIFFFSLSLTLYAAGNIALIHGCHLGLSMGGVGQEDKTRHQFICQWAWQAGQVVRENPRAVLLDGGGAGVSDDAVAVVVH